MKWFKHFSDASDDEKIALLVSEFGGDGYMFYWRILETIAGQMKPESPKTYLVYAWEKWAKCCGLSQQKFKKILNFSSTLSLFFLEKFEKTLKIDCPKLLEIKDNHFKNLQVAGNKLAPRSRSRSRVREEIKETVKENAALKIEIDPALQNQFERICGMSNALTVWLVDCRYPPDWIREALTATAERAPAKPIPYCKGILESYAKNGGVTGGRSGGYSGAGGDSGKQLRYASGAAEREAGKFAGMD